MILLTESESEHAPSDWEDDVFARDEQADELEKGWSLVMNKKERRRNRRLTIAGPQVFESMMMSSQNNRRDENPSEKGKKSAVKKSQSQSCNTERGREKHFQWDFGSGMKKNRHINFLDEFELKKQKAEEIKMSLFGQSDQVKQSSSQKDEQKRVALQDKTEMNIEMWAKHNQKARRASPSKEAKQAEDVGPTRKFPFGTSLEDIYEHARPTRISRWLWLPKGKATAAALLGLGFPARKSEIERFGSEARRIHKAKPHQRDSRTYKEVVTSEMSRNEGAPRPRSYGQEKAGEGSYSRRFEDRDRRDDGQFRYQRREEERYQRREEDNQQRYQRREDDQQRYQRQGREDDQQRYQRQEDDQYRFQRQDQGSRMDRDRSDMNRGKDRYDEPRRDRDNSFVQGDNQMGNNKRQMDNRDQEELERNLRSKLMRDKEEMEGRGRGQNYNQKVWNQQRRPPFEPEVRDILCYNCNKTGHHQGQCGNPPFCYSCRNTGHKAMQCPLKKGLQLCGFGFQGAMFHRIKLPGNKRSKPKEVLGLMTVTDGIATAGIVERELKVLISDTYQWVVKEVEENEFLITFPDEASRDSMTRFKSFEFQTDEIVAKVQATDRPAGTFHTLKTVWVRAYNWHPDGRTEDIVKEVAYMVGSPVTVDLKSLDQDGPIRVQVKVWDPALIYGETNVVFDEECRKIKWVVEKEGKSGAGPSKEPHKFDRYKDDKEDDDKEDDYYDDLGEEEDIENKDKQGDKKDGKTGQKVEGKQTHKQASSQVVTNENKTDTSTVEGENMGTKRNLEQEVQEMKALEDKIEARAAQLAPWLKIGSVPELSQQGDMEELSSQVINEMSQEDGINNTTTSKDGNTIIIPQPPLAGRTTKRKMEDDNLVQEKAEARKAKINNIPEMECAS